MTDHNNEITNMTEYPKSRQKDKKSMVKRVFSNVLSGAIGSVLTLTLITYTPIFSKMEESGQATSTQTTAKQEKASTSQSYPVQQVAKNSSSVADMVEAASKAIVGIAGATEQQQGLRQMEQTELSSGSGVVFKIDGDQAFIVTNNHVIEGMNQIEVSLESGKTATAQLIGSDALTDLAVLAIDSKDAENVMEFGDSDTLRAGDQVFAIGNPLGLDFSRTVTQGIVSAVNRSVSVTTSAGDWDLNVIQTDAAINPGNSGGALVNAEGKLVGINSLKIAQSGVEGLGFAIPSNDVKPLVEQLIKTGNVKRPYMGISMMNVDQIPRNFLQQLPNNLDGGVLVTSVDPSSPAGKAGLQANDIIVKMNKKDITNLTELRKILYTELKVGDKVTLELYRNGKLQKVEMTLTSNSGTNQ